MVCRPTAQLTTAVHVGFGGQASPQDSPESGRILPFLMQNCSEPFLHLHLYTFQLLDITSSASQLVDLRRRIFNPQQLLGDFQTKPVPFQNESLIERQM